MEEQTTDAVVNAPGSIFGIPTFEDVANEQAESGDRTTGVEHMTPDNDPYGWIAGVEAAHPDFAQPAPQPQVPHALIWQHGMIEPQRFDHAVAKVLPNGTLLVTPRSSDVPLKGYAPGVWVTFEHIGDEYHQKPQPFLTPEQQQVVDRDRARAASRPGRPFGTVQVDNYAAQEKVAVDEMTRVLTDPTRRTPPTHEQDADDTQTIPVVKTVVVSPADGEGGGVVRPFGRGVRKDADSTEHPDRRRTDDPEGDEKRPGWFRSLWHSLKDPDWSED